MFIVSAIVAADYTFMDGNDIAIGDALVAPAYWFFIVNHLTQANGTGIYNPDVGVFLLRRVSGWANLRPGGRRG